MHMYTMFHKDVKLVEARFKLAYAQFSSCLWHERLGKGLLSGWRRVNTHITFNVTHERAYDKGAYDLEALFYVQHVAGTNMYMAR